MRLSNGDHAIYWVFIMRNPLLNVSNKSTQPCLTDIKNLQVAELTESIKKHNMKRNGFKRL